MIEADLRKSVVTLHNHGMKIREIERRLGISRNTVRAIIGSGGEIPTSLRSDSIAVDQALLVKLHADCNGWLERVWEKLTEEHGVKIGYSTLTRKMRALGLDEKPRAAHVADVAGAEMQHDTSPYRLQVGVVWVNVIASLIYLRYCKQYYLKFYRSFDRFRMKTFFHEALHFWGYAAPVCIIDNTHLAVLRGTGKNAVIGDEMAQFSKRYGFRFVAHEIKHSDRKAGNERAFWTVEANFFPGRTFSSEADLNAQAFDWATCRQANRPRGKSRLIPAQAFEYEKAFLQKICVELPPPYRVHERAVDQYGFVAFAANYYWLPSGIRGDVKVLEYSCEIKIFAERREIARFPLPPAGVRNKIFPEDRPSIPRSPRNREGARTEEEKIMRDESPEVAAYIDFLLTDKGLGRHRKIRELFRVYRRLSRNLFCQVIARAHRFKVTDTSTLDEIARLLVRDDLPIMPDVAIDETYSSRDSFHEGRFTDRPDFSTYDQLLEESESE